MRNNNFIFSLLDFAIILSACNTTEQDSKYSVSLIIKNPYLGQKLLVMIPEVFAPGIVSKKDWEIEGVFTPGIKEFNFARYRRPYK